MRATWLKRSTGRTVLVHTKDDQTFEGVITAVHSDGLVLGVVKLHGTAGPVPMAGDTFIPKDNLSLVQLP